MAATTQNSIFASKEFCFLRWLQSREQPTARGAVINFSQEEIALDYGCSPATINKWLQALETACCVEQIKKGSYHITVTGNAVIAKMCEIEKIIGGKRHGH